MKHATFIHHERVDHAGWDEAEAFDVIEVEDGFNVYQAGLLIGQHDTLSDAVSAANECADEWHRRHYPNAPGAGNRPDLYLLHAGPVNDAKDYTDWEFGVGGTEDMDAPPIYVLTRDNETGAVWGVYIADASSDGVTVRDPAIVDDMKAQVGL